MTKLIDLVKSVPTVNDIVARAVLYSRDCCFDEAMRDFNYAVMLDPKHIEALWYRHLVYLERGLLDEALRDLENILIENRSYIPAYQGKAKIQEETGNLKGAINCFNNMVRIKPDDSLIRYHRGLILEKDKVKTSKFMIYLGFLSGSRRLPSGIFP